LIVLAGASCWSSSPTRSSAVSRPDLRAPRSSWRTLALVSKRSCSDDYAPTLLRNRLALITLFAALMLVLKSC